MADAAIREEFKAANAHHKGAPKGFSDQYIVLDTFQKVETSRADIGEFTFNFRVEGETGEQSIGVSSRLDQIIGIQACAFSIPVLPRDDFDPARLVTLTPALASLGLADNAPVQSGDATTDPQSQTPFSGRVTMFFKEIGRQSFSDADARRHHFEFDAAVAGASTPVRAAGGGPPEHEDPSTLGDRLSLKPLADCEHYTFTDPILDIHGLTLGFYNPGNYLRFPPDCLYGVGVRSTAAGDFLEFAYTDKTNLVNLARGDRIYIQDFFAYYLGDPVVGPGGVTAPAKIGHQTLNTFISRPEGHQVGHGGFVVTPPTSSTSGTSVTFRLNPDVVTTGVVPAMTFGNAAAGGSRPLQMRDRVTVRIAKNRLRIPLRFRRLMDRVTNHAHIHI